MIRLRAISKTRGEGAHRFTLKVPELDLWPGQRLALVGASGSGKSTLLDLLALVLSPDPGGRLEFSDETGVTCLASLWRAGAHDALAALRSRHFGYVLQTGGLLGFLSVRGNIALSRQLLGLADDDTVMVLAQALDISAQLDKKPAALSVGQRQRVAIARALAHRPRLILADEPTASLDPINADSVMQLLIRQAEARHACCVVATHDHRLAERAGLTPLVVQIHRDDDGGITATVGGGC